MNCIECKLSATWHVGLDRFNQRFTPRIVVEPITPSSVIKESQFGIPSGPVCYRHAVIQAQKLNDQFGIQEDG